TRMDARMSQQAMEGLSDEPEFGEKRREPARASLRVPFSLVPFFWASKRKELAAGLPPARNVKRDMNNVS
ncbi:MAG: hypothetical protein KAR30_01255, partial [Gammaproteobacteria bacterium]|nr:hypothetical protein [Gammaproteobacteria bacterium]